MPTNLQLSPPSEKQKLFLLDHHRHVAFGGSRGGGKSFAVRQKAVLIALKYPGSVQCIVRKTYPELTENHIKPLKALLRVGAKDALATYNDARKEFHFKNGSEILLKQCDSDKALDKFQGLEFDALYIDEATQMSEWQVKVMNACVRGDRCPIKRTYYTCNPGGIGHGWVKRIFIDKKYELGENPDDYSFIQSLVTDNKHLMRTDPGYVKQLEALPPKLRLAWLEGRWDVFQGAYFECFRETPDPQKCFEAGIDEATALREHRWTHVIEPFDIPQGWKRYRSYDFGYGKPFSCAWWVQDYEGVLYRILELYGCTATPNEGVKWSPSEQFRRIKEIEDTHPWLKGHKVQGVADPSIWDGSRGISVNEEAEKHQLWFVPGVNDRVPGWLQVQERMMFDENGYAMMYFFNTCKAIIRTMPLMMYDEHKAEDLNTDLEDHACDDVRYMCMMRPIAPREIETKYVPISDPLDQFTKGQPLRRIY